MGSEDKVRIASDFATFPFRLMSQNAPINWGQGAEPQIQLRQKDVNLRLAEDLLKSNAPILYADDVLLTHSVEGKDRIDLRKIRDIPTAVPAFDRMFIEVDISDNIAKTVDALAGYVVSDPFNRELTEKLRDTIYSHANKLNSRNIPVTEDDIKGIDVEKAEGNGDDSIEELQKLFAGFRIPKWIFRAGPIDKESIPIIETARFIAIYPYIYGHHISDDRGSQCIGPVGCVYYMVDPNKGLVRSPNGEPFMFWLDPTEANEETHYIEKNAEYFRDCVETAAAVCLRSMALLNCSNVEIVKTGETSEGGKKARQARRKHGGHHRGGLKHHELRVKVGKQLIRVSGDKDSTGGRALGMVRGHFRDYSRGKGLFGQFKYPAVWVPPHARGNAENGVVTADYVLIPNDHADSQ